MPSPKNLFKKMARPFIQRATKNYLSNAQVLKGFIDGQGFLLTQPKTGTNFIVNVIAFYNAELIGDRDLTLDDRYSLGIVHGGHIVRDSSGITEALKFHRRSQQMMITRFHDDVPGVRPALLIATTRNVLDQFTSLWYYQYETRGISVDDAIPELVQQYVARNHAQAEIAGRSDKALFVRYEDLIERPEEAFQAIITAAYGNCQMDLLARAIERSSTKNFKEWEAKRGKPAISEELAKTQKSFIRSGKIGEGEEFFSEAQREQIARLMRESGISLDGDRAAQ